MGGASDDSYRLQALRSMRERDEAGRTAELADAIARTARARERVDECDRRVQSARGAEREHARRAAQRAAAGAGVADMLGDRHYRDRLSAARGGVERALTDARDNLADVEADERSARDRLATAVRERKAVEAHFESWQAVRARARARKAELEADDIAMRGNRDDE